MSDATGTPLSLARVLERVASEQRRGWLEVDALDGRIELGFDSGRLVAARGVGDVSLGLDPALEILGPGVGVAWREVRSADANLPAIEAIRALENAGWLNERAAQAFAEHILVEAALAMLPRVGLLGRFRDGGVEADHPRVAVDVATLLQQGDVRHRERLAVERRMPDPATRVRPSSEAPKWKRDSIMIGATGVGPPLAPSHAGTPEGPHDLSLLERWMLARAVHGPTVGDLVDGAPFGNALAARAFVRLLSANLLELSAPGTDAVKPAGVSAVRRPLATWLRWAGVGLVMGSVFALALWRLGVSVGLGAAGLHTDYAASAWAESDWHHSRLDMAVEGYVRAHGEPPSGWDALVRGGWLDGEDDVATPVGRQWSLHSDPRAEWGARVMLGSSLPGPSLEQPRSNEPRSNEPRSNER